MAVSVREWAGRGVEWGGGGGLLMGRVRGRLNLEMMMGVPIRSTFDNFEGRCLGISESGVRAWGIRWSAGRECALRLRNGSGGRVALLD